MHPGLQHQLTWESSCRLPQRDCSAFSPASGLLPRTLSQARAKPRLRPRLQPWPQRTITILVPFPPGPAADLVARLIGAKISTALGQSVVVENRTGANGTIGSNAVARAAPDGYTLLMGTAGTHVTAVHLMKSLPYDPVKDFTPIIAAVEPVTCLAVNASCR